MDPDTALLPLCVALALIGLLATVVLWRSRRASRGRILQGLAWTLVPVALYLTGLLRMVWDAVVTLADWASEVIFSPAVWAGFSLLGVALVLFVVGGLLVRRSRLRSDSQKAGTGRAADRPEVGRGKQLSNPQSGGAKPGGKQPVDDEMAEIEALLKSRGIE